MSKAQIDNSHFDIKVRLRFENLPAKKKFTVLDCYCGDGLLWKKVRRLAPNRKINILGIDKKPDAEGFHLVGENLKFLKCLDLSKYDAIDLDAYGIPYKQIQAVLTAETIRRGTIIYVTFIQSVYGCLPATLLNDLGYPPEMVRKIPTLFYRHGFEKIKRYLASRGVRKIRHYADAAYRKHYFCFTL